MIKMLFFALFIKPIVFIVLGLNLQGYKQLPLKGPAVVAANHNSHLDVLVLMSLYPLRRLKYIRPVAAADYFFQNKLWAWIATRCIDIIPIQRSGQSAEQVLEACHQALEAGQILILFPEGSRGQPEQIGKIKKGLFYLMQQHPQVPITPVFMRGLGKALPRGEALFVPFNCDVIISEPLGLAINSREFVIHIRKVFDELSQRCLGQGF
ncbi:lysophospholipid acyltransferase family protein [uncultured Thiothrix sp.]|uniref:lysophospholipid acyltransferase family protein n=1 Tax=uncultured Thiothrix sp. TaxID=223185 RepID=UPI002622A56E|nr:lysophospholipid acyltransferase family protein [uncultured Thiothrix sp.]